MIRNRRWNVLARNPGVQQRGLATGKGHRSFQGKAQMVISDPAEAREIETAYGKHGSKQVHVIEDERLGWHMDHDRQTDGRNSDIHHYVFSGVDLKGIRRTKPSAYVWARVDGKQVRMLRERAVEEGYEFED